MQALLLFAAALIAAELLHRPDDELGTDDADRFSAAAPLAAAAGLLFGPLQAFAVTVACVAPVRRLQRDSWRESGVRAISLGAAAFGAGYAYVIAGAEIGALSLPDDLLALTVFGVTFAVVKTLVVRLASRSVAFEPDLLSASAEVALGAALAIAADANLWNAALLVPVLVLLERLHARMTVLRREVASALETFANLVDERDAYTHRHSIRVAEMVRQLAEALGLPKADAQRLWWAGRLHDLGKVAVDASVFRKTGLLNIHDWRAVRRAPRLSARLLQRFRFAAQQAKAVEYHRERFDGSGYYGARGEDVPLAAHILIVADAYDAMVSDRPFREPLTPEQALMEIERNAGTQFHPSIARAFAAMQRGQPLEDVLSGEELASIRATSAPAAPRRPIHELRRRPELLILLGAVVALLGLATELLEVSAVGLVFALVGARFWLAAHIRASRLGGRVDAALDRPVDRSGLFFALVEAFGGAWPQEFALLVAWHDDGTDGTIELAQGSSGVPVAELTSWLLRESESERELIVDDNGEVGRTGCSFALPLRRENSALVGFLVLGGSRQPPLHVLAAARSRLDRIGLALADAPEYADEPRIALVAQ